MRVLVTGGAGFKGCVVADALMRQGHEVTVFDSLRYGEASAMALLHRGASVVRGDITRVEQITPEVRRHDAVIHLAALVGFPLCDAEPVWAEAVNVGGTRNVVAALQPGQPLIYASTGSVYGRVGDICTEDQTPRPLTRYGRSKLEGERIAVGCGGAALRFATVIGVSPCMRFDLMVNAFVYRAIHVGWLALYQASDRRSFIDVADAAKAYEFSLRHYDVMSGGVYNVGNCAMNLTKQQVADAVCKQFAMRIISGNLQEDPDQRDYEVTFERMSALGFRPTVSLEESIAEIGAAARLVGNTASWRFCP